MLAYIIRRLLLIIPTLFGIMIINFAVIQTAPGGPVEQIIAQIQGNAVDATARVTGGGSDLNQDSLGEQQRLDQGGGFESKYRGARGLPPDLRGGGHVRRAVRRRARVRHGGCRAPR